MENQTPTMTPPPPGPPPLSGSDAEQKVAGPAIALIVTAIIGILTQFFRLILSVFNVGMLSGLRNIQPPEGAEGFESFISLFTGAMIGLTIISVIIALIASVIMIIAGIRMKKLQSWGLAVTASILAMLPCLGPCCCIGLPIGIWALVVLMKPEVKTAFQ
jgi:hypothetical protein